MDPNQTLRNLRKAILNHQTGEDCCSQDTLNNMFEYFEALDGWLSKGGFLPGNWDGSKSSLAG